jgi:hypothetical protein
LSSKNKSRDIETKKAKALANALGEEAIGPDYEEADFESESEAGGAIGTLRQTAMVLEETSEILRGAAELLQSVADGLGRDDPPAFRAVDLKEAVDALAEDSLFSEVDLGSPDAVSAEKELLRALMLVIERSLAQDRALRLWTKEANLSIVQELGKLGHRVSPDGVGQLLEKVGFARVKPRRSPKPRSSSAKSFNSGEVGEAGEVGEVGEVGEDQNSFMAAQIAKAFKNRSPILAIETKTIKNSKSLTFPPVAPADSGPDLEPGRATRAKASFTRRILAEEEEPVFYDLATSDQQVVVESGLDEASLALSSIIGWWEAEGEKLFPGSDYLLLTTKGGPVNGYGGELWLTRLKTLARAIGRPLRVCHAPLVGGGPSFSGRLLFSFFSNGWRGEKKHGFETVVRSLGQAGEGRILPSNCWVDHGGFDFRLEAKRRELREVEPLPMEFNGEMNYVVSCR